MIVIYNFFEIIKRFFSLNFYFDLNEMRRPKQKKILLFFSKTKGAARAKAEEKRKTNHYVIDNRDPK